MKKQKTIITKKLLIELVQAGGILTAIAVAPQLLLIGVARTLYKDITKTEVQNTFYYMKRNGWIKTAIEQNRIAIQITEKGKRHIAKASIMNVKPLVSKKWDKKWRVVSYDIPSRFSDKRRALLLFLRHLGFERIHKSVWVSPYDCSKELNALILFFELQQNQVRLIISEDIGDTVVTKKTF